MTAARAAKRPSGQAAKRPTSEAWPDSQRTELLRPGPSSPRRVWTPPRWTHPADDPELAAVELDARAPGRYSSTAPSTWTPPQELLPELAQDAAEADAGR